MSKHWWIGVVAMGLSTVGTIRADGPPEVRVLVGSPNVTVAADAPGVQALGGPITILREGGGKDVLAELGEYWMGLVCSPADATLRAQLKLPDQQGLVVEEAAPDGPAAKAGIQPHDVLLKANDKPLGKVADLMEVINKVKDGKIALQLVRGGKPQTVTVSPAKRPKGAWTPGLPGGPGMPDRAAIEKLLEKAGPGGENMTFHIIRPGTILPPGAPLPPPVKLPENMSITITREGSKPAQITVKEGDKKWEVTENDLGKLPENVQIHLAQMLPQGRIWFRNFTLPVPAPGAGRPPVPGPTMERHPLAPGDVQKQLQDLNQRIEQLRKAVDEMHAKQPGRAPEKLPPADKPK